MTEKAKVSKNDKEFEDLLNILDPQARDEFESEFANIFEEMSKEEEIASIIEDIIEKTDDIQEIQSKLTLLIIEHLRKKSKSSKNHIDIDKSDEKKVTRDIQELCRKFLHSLDQEPDQKLARISRKDRAHILDAQAKKQIKKIMKAFAVYEMYKVMNPRRIAGETEKSNFVHNLVIGGKKLAFKYAKSDLRGNKINAVESSRLQREAYRLKKNSPGKDSGRSF